MKKHTRSSKIAAIGMAGLLILTLFASNMYAKDKKRGSTLEITTTEGRVIRAELLAVKNNRLILMETYSFQESILDLDEIADLNITKQSKFLQGLGVGVLSGAAFGGALGFASGNDKPGFFSFSAGEKAAVGAIGLGAVGLVVGGITGVIKGIDEYVQVSDYTDEEKTKLIRKLRSHARVDEYQVDPDIQTALTTKRLDREIIKHKTIPAPKKPSSRFHLTLGPGYFQSNSYRGYKRLLINSQFADTKPGGRITFLWADLGSYPASDYPKQIKDPNWYFKDIRVEYSLNRNWMLGLGYTPLGSHSSHGYRYIPIDTRTYSELYLTGDYTGSFYYLSGAWMTMPDGFLQKTSIKIGMAAGVSSARMDFRVSRYAYSGSDTPGSRMDMQKTTPAFMAFTELNYFFNRHWSIGLNADFKYIPVKLPGFQMTGQYPVDYISGQGFVYESLQVECSGCRIDLGGYAIGMHFGFHF
jgi:hypothetical protein